MHQEEYQGKTTKTPGKGLSVYAPPKRKPIGNCRRSSLCKAKAKKPTCETCKEFRAAFKERKEEAPTAKNPPQEKVKDFGKKRGLNEVKAVLRVTREPGPPRRKQPPQNQVTSPQRNVFVSPFVQTAKSARKGKSQAEFPHQKRLSRKKTPFVIQGQEQRGHQTKWKKRE